MTTEVTKELRPCMVAQMPGGKEERALFHCWNQWAAVTEASPLRGGSPAGQIAETYGIVEFENGTVRNVRPASIRFLDSKFENYDWGGDQE